MKTPIGWIAILILSLAIRPASALAQDTQLVTVEGTLRDVVTRAPIENGFITLSERNLSVLSDSLGTFRLTDMAIGVYWLTISARGYLTAEGEFAVNRAGQFSIMMEPVDAPERREFGAIRGTVRDQQTGNTVETALISIPAMHLTTLSDSDGRFSFPDIVPGNYLLKTEHLGFGPRSDSLLVSIGELVLVDVELSIEPIELDGISVEVERRLLSLDMSGFYGRQRATSGQFLTSEDIEDRHAFSTTDIFTGLHGVRVVRTMGMENAIVLRAGYRQSLSGTGGMCGPTVYLDGFPMMGGVESASALLDRFVSPEQIAGIEVYSSSASIPLQYKGVGSNCGVIVIWTK